MDIWDKKKRSEVMSKIRSKNTKPEMALRKALFAKGFRYRINYKKLPGKPDIAFPKYKTAIFVHGCFWHGHEDCKISHIPKSNTEFWEHKISTNKERDKRSVMRILSLGWKVFTVWECEISKNNLPNILDKIIEILHKKESFPSVAKIKFYEEIDNEVMKVAEDVVFYGKRTPNK
jgi:DNA mismatch endonuclease (patch repair protein)